MPISPQQAKKSYEEAHAYDQVLAQIDAWLIKNYATIEAGGHSFNLPGGMPESTAREISHSYPGWLVEYNQDSHDGDTLRFSLPNRERPQGPYN